MPRFLAIALAVSALLAAGSYALTSQGYRIDLGGDEPSEVTGSPASGAEPDCVTYDDLGKLSPTGDGTDCAPESALREGSADPAVVDRPTPSEDPSTGELFSVEEAYERCMEDVRADGLDSSGNPVTQADCRQLAGE